MHLCHIFLLLMCVWHIDAHCEKEGSSVVQPKCDATDYNSYLVCVRKRRNKRHADCHLNCDDCNCEQCQYETCSSDCTSCCQTYQTCQTNYCCHKTCHSQCQTSPCRSKCKKDCRDSITNGGGNGHASSHRHNATTHIRTEINVHNMINNTNIIDVPINVTTLNFNNITLTNEAYHGSNGSFGGTGYPPPYPPYPPYPPLPYPTFPPHPPHPPYPTPPHPPYPTPPPYPPPPPYPHPPPQPHSPCCVVATPQVCRPQISVPYVSCSYRTQRVCQSYCDAPVVHPRVRHGCHQELECEDSVYYSQQPGSTCAFQPSYPYFGCGVPHGPYEALGGQYGANGGVGGVPHGPYEAPIGQYGVYGGPGGEFGPPAYGDYVSGLEDGL